MGWTSADESHVSPPPLNAQGQLYNHRSEGDGNEFESPDSTATESLEETTLQNTQPALSEAVNTVDISDDDAAFNALEAVNGNGESVTQADDPTP